jgi:hypothetical protein
MSYNLILNKGNSIGRNNTTYQFNFLNGSFTVGKDTKMCIGEMTIPYAWFNITSVYQNNVFQIVDWLGNIYTITLQDGFYSLADIQVIIEQFCITNKLYLVNDANQNVYYILLATNPVFYANQIITFQFPYTSAAQLPTGWTAPSGFIGYPAVAKATSVIILNNNFQTYLGFTAGTYGGTPDSSNYLSNITPVGSTVNSVVVRCSLVSNNAGFPTDILDSFPITTAFGTNINYQPTFEKWVRLTAGTYSSFTLTLVDQNFQTIYSQDSNSTISLLIKDE